LMEDLLKDGYDYEDYTENFQEEEKKSCCKDRKDGSKGGCGCGQGGILIKK